MPVTVASVGLPAASTTWLCLVRFELTHMDPSEYLTPVTKGMLFTSCWLKECPVAQGSVFDRFRTAVSTGSKRGLAGLRLKSRTAVPLCVGT